MKPFLPAIIVFTSLALCFPVLAQTVATDPVGAVNITIKANSDTVVAVPLTPLPVYTGTVSATAGAGANLAVTGSTGWTANQFANLYYLRMTSGAKNGMYYTVTSNTASQVTIDGAGDNLSSIAAGDSFKILKYWTLGTLFSPASVGTAANPLTASASTSPIGRGTEILVADPNAAGINNSASASYYFTSSNWYVAGSNVVSDNIILYPDSPFTIRQPARVATDVAWSSVGSVALDSLSMPLLTRVTGPQDNAVALVRPIDMKLSELGLEAAFAQSASTSPISRTDELFVFDNTASGINKSAAKIYYRTNGTWRKAGADSVVADSDVIRAGDAFTIRKSKTITGASVVWTNRANF